MDLSVMKMFALLTLLALSAASVWAQTDHTFAVNSLADTGRQSGAPAATCTTGSTVSCPSGQCAECTLRAAIETVNSLSFGQSATIAFADYIPTNSSNPPASMFQPVNGYNSFGREVHIDGTTHPEWDPDDGIPAVIIRGDDAVAAANGLNFGPGGAGSVVDAVAVYNFPQIGIRINADNVTVRQSHIGISAGGTGARPNAVGIHLLGDNNLIGYPPMLEAVVPWPNVISGNTGDGVIVGGNDNTVAGNRIGVRKNGASAVANGGHGIRVEGSQATIGDWSVSGFSVLTARNQVAGNSEAQVYLAEDANQASIYCNHIGTNANASVPISGSSDGILVHSSGNQIGAASCRNVISGVIEMGDADTASSNNMVVWNFIGTNADGDDLGVMGALVTVVRGNGNQIANNTIGNGIFGISLLDQTSGTTVRANFIGTDSDNRMHPLLGGIFASGTSNSIGGSQPSDGNVIGHVPDGVAVLAGSSSQAVQIIGNHVGVSPDGTPLPVLVGIESSGTDTVIGLAGAGNIIGHASDSGIHLNSLSSGAQVLGNWVGVDPDGTAIGDGTGIGVQVAGADHEVGNANVIGHWHTGIEVSQGSHRIANNRIGTGSDGESFPNSTYGIRLRGDSSNNEVVDNWIGNSARGIRVNVNSSTHHFGHNWIGVTPAGQDIGNSLYGFYTTSADNSFGYDGNDWAPNVVGYNGAGGVWIAGPGNLVMSNYIGVMPDSQLVPNAGSGGVILLGEYQSSYIGLNFVETANYIAGNHGHGIDVRNPPEAGNYYIASNFIGIRPDGTDGGNGGSGIYLGDGVERASITPQSLNPGSKLQIAYNQGNAIELSPDAGTGNRIQGFDFWANAGKAVDLGPGGRDQDAGDGDTGPNNLQNFPEFDNALSGANFDTGQIELRYRIDSSPQNSAYPIRVDIYLAAPDGSEGTYIGFVTYEEADAQTFVIDSIPFPGAWQISGQEWFAAIATDDDGNSSEMSDPFGGPPTYTIGGVISNLSGSGLVLQNNGGDDLTISQTGTFSFQFDTLLPEGADYDVTVSQQPSNQLCSVSNGSGTVGTESVNDIQVSCQAAGDQIFQDRFEPGPEPSFSFSEQLAPTFHHPRCVTCHAVEATNFQRVNDDPPGVLPASHPLVNATTDCTGCHTSSLLPPTGSIDPGWQSAPAAFDFRGLDDATLCNMASQPVSGHTPLDHLTEDRLVLWAVGDGRVPSGNPDLPTAPPHDIEDWRALVIEWVDAGMPCD